MAGGTPIPVWVAKAGTTLVVRPEGACTVHICETLEAGLRRLVTAQMTQVCIDLSRAAWLDSTFTGLLVGLATRGRLGDAKVSLISPSAAAQSCLEKMHVLELFARCDEPGLLALQWERLPEVATDAQTAADRVIDSHEQLIEADARNAPAFEPVVRMFRKSRGDSG